MRTLVQFYWDDERNCFVLTGHDGKSYKLSNTILTYIAPKRAEIAPRRAESDKAEE